jgi:fructuronate reductase
MVWLKPLTSFEGHTLMPDHPVRQNPLRPGIGIVHLGPGAFFRAFNAIYTADAMAASGGDWGICGISLRSPKLRDQLVAQDWAYTAVTLAPDGRAHRVIESLNTVLVAPEDPEAALAVMSDQRVKIVSLTITEKGYCHRPSTGALQRDHPDIQHDLAHPNAPRSAIGFLVHALDRRRKAGLAPFTILSCDNLPQNGVLIQGLVLEFAKLLDPALAEWIVKHARFPSTMVDRITPAATSADVETLQRETGVNDPACVVHEPFRQWVIEDDFVGNARPDWAAAGVQFVNDVAPFETMKLRCLNGTHSALAYLGYLAGKETVYDAVSDPVYAAFLRDLWQHEIIPTVPTPEGTELTTYAKVLLERYKNPAIRHLTWQIAMDGSQKLPQRLLGPAADNIAARRPIPGLALTLAAWMRYVGGTRDDGDTIDVRDPLADRLTVISQDGTNPAEIVAAFLSIREVFPNALATTPTFVAAVVAAYTDIVTHGIYEALRRHVERKGTAQ